jgi:hypothetical protein
VRTQAYGRVGGAQNLVIGDSDFIYVLTEKTYIFHHIEGVGELVSYSHAPNCALAEGVFLRKECALTYVKYYANRDEPSQRIVSRLESHTLDK